MKTNPLTISLVILFLAVNFLTAQNDSSLKDKVNKIKGDATKIVISTSEGDVTFEGDEAVKLLKEIKSPKFEKKMHWISENDEDVDIDGDNVMIFKSDDGKKHIIKHKGHGSKMILLNDNDDKDLKTIKVNLEDENGEKTLTVTTKENGEEKVETYKGKEADEYIEKMNKEGEMLIEINKGDSSSTNVWVNHEKDGIKKNVEVEIENDVKTVTVTTNENGEEKVETFTGEDAEKYLKEMDKEDKMINGKKHKKIIIKEIEEDEKN